MSRLAVRRAVLPIALVAALVAPGTASAWSVTVHVHGAGKVVETTDAHLMDCTAGGSGVAESTVTDCVAGSSAGGYSSGWIVGLQAQVPQTLYDRGWRFLKWVDNGAGGQVNCDPQPTVGDHLDPDCRFQIWDNLQTNVYFDDVAGPNATAITSHPASATKLTSATFGFDASDDPDASYECRLDRPGEAAGSWTTCGSPSDKSEAYSSLTTNGTYTFYVRGRDPSGNLDVTPASHAWTVDTVAPTVTIGGTPANGAVTSSTTASFTVGATEGASPSCTLDGVATPCGTAKSALSEGSHTFVARATDAAGNVGTASRMWTIDTTAPQTTITSGPADGGASGTGTTFAFTASEAGPTFQCTVDGAASPCASPMTLTGLAPGSHMFSVVATDAVGNVDATPATRTWTVDVTPPETQLLDGPAEGSTTPQRTATFTFASPESASTYECRIDDEPFAACTSPATFDDLPLGDHTFQVRAKDAAGNVDATPATRSWRVNPLDADADGFNRPQDCRDDDPAVHPGATDVPGDGIDQDCDGRDAVASSDTTTTTPPQDATATPGTTTAPPQDATATPGTTTSPPSGTPAALPPARARLSYRWGPPAAQTKVVKLIVSGLAKGAKVTVSCRGMRCPLRRKSVTAPSSGRVDVRRLLKGRPFAAGSSVTITISLPQHVSRVAAFSFRRGQKPTGGVLRCLPPGASKAAACA